MYQIVNFPLCVFFPLQSPNKPTIPQEKIRPLTSLDHPQSPFYDPEGGSITQVARVVIERIARKVLGYSSPWHRPLSALESWGPWDI